MYQYLFINYNNSVLKNTRKRGEIKNKRNLLHQKGNIQEMGAFLVKIHINKMDPTIKKMQRDRLAVQEPLAPACFPLIVLGFPFPGIVKEEKQGQARSAAPQTSDRTQHPHLLRPGSPREDAVLSASQG